MIPNWDFWDIIAIIIALGTLHKDFNTATASLFETDNKTINKIKSILQSKKTNDISKRAIRETSELAMAFRDNNKRKIVSHKEGFNYHKLGYFGRDCPYLNKRLQ